MMTDERGDPVMAARTRDLTLTRLTRESTRFNFWAVGASRSTRDQRFEVGGSTSSAWESAEAARTRSSSSSFKATRISKWATALSRTTRRSSMREMSS